MADKKDISSTEKLLSVIRSKDGVAEDFLPDFDSPGIWQRTRQKLFSSGAGTFVGIEIFQDMISLIQMRKTKGDWEILFASSVTIPEEMHLEAPEFRDFLKAQMRNLKGARHADIWVCLPPSRGEVWTVRVPKLKKGLTNAVYWSARKEKNFDENEYLFDYRVKDEITEQGIKKLLVEVCIASKQDVDLLNRMFYEIGYPLKGITLPAYAVKNLFASKWIDPEPEPCAILYIGGDSSYIEIQDGHFTLFSRVVKTGRDSILDSMTMECRRPESSEFALESEESGVAAATASDISRQQASRMFAGSGECSRDKMEVCFSDDQLFEMIRPAMERLSRQLERTIDYSVNVLNHPAPACIKICGGIPFLEKLPIFFSEQLGFPTEILAISCPEDASAFTESSMQVQNHRNLLVSVMAVAMASEKTVNFLHTAVDRDKEKEALRNANAVAAACAILFVFTAGYWWMTRHDLQQARMQKMELQQRMEMFSPAIGTEDIARLAGEMKARKSELLEYSRKLQPVAILQEVNRLTPENINLVGARLDLGRPGGNQSTGKRKMLVVDGFITGDPSRFETHLTGYLFKLRRSPLFNDTVIRKSVRDVLHTGENIYRFTLNIDLEQV